MPDEITPARQEVETEIRTKGPITFARFMEIALYGEAGYYTKAVKAGADYATSPQMHPAFGSLIAGWLFKAWEALGEPGEFDVVELGAGDGGLMRDVLDAVSGGDSGGGFETALNYRSFDIRPRGPVSEIDGSREIEGIVGCVISNELLDAFPVHVFTVRGGKVLECYVGLNGGEELVWVEGEVSRGEIVDRVSIRTEALPDGYRGEVNLGVGEWAASVSRILERGYVLTVDYGCEQEMLYHPGRVEGSLRCYRDHVLGQNPFRDVGLQDMTAHVDFTAVGEALRGVGFVELANLRTQRNFMFDLGASKCVRDVRRALTRAAEDDEVSSLTSELRRLNALVDPRGLGGFLVAQHGIGTSTFDVSVLETNPVFQLPVRGTRHLSEIPYD